MRFLERVIINCLAGVVALGIMPACSYSQSAQIEQKKEAAKKAPGARTIERGDQIEEDSGEGEQLSTAELEARAKKRELGDEEYPLHKPSREISGELKCPEVEVVEYEGEAISYNQPIEVAEDFRDRLMRFEKVVAEVATEIYGRAPDRIVHAGGHTCKTVGSRGKKLSEHAFALAIDVSGFEFDAVGEEADIDAVAEKARESFSISLKEHWGAKSGFASTHAQFLRRLAQALKERGPFSTMLGPAYEGHDIFFHFDFGPQFFFRI